MSGAPEGLSRTSPDEDLRPAPADLRPPGPALSWAAYRAEFPIFERVTYLNTCSLGALGARVRAAVGRFLDLWDAWGASAWYGPWWEELDALRGSFAAVIGADRSEVALAPSITGALTAVAGCFDYAARPRVIVSDIDFPTVPYQWLARRGIEVVYAPSPDGLGVPVETFERLIDERTQLVVASHVYFQSGEIQDVTALARLTHARGALLLVDAYQSVGQVPVDVRTLGVDFLVAGGLKWLLGGPGIAYLYVRRELHAALAPSAVGWFAHGRQFAFDTRHFEYADDARRFQGGTPSVAAIYAARAGLEYVHEIGPARLRARQIELLTDLAAGLAEIRALRPRMRGRVQDLAGILTVPVADPAAAVAGLREHGVIVDARPGVIRLSPYFYNTAEDFERTVAALRRHLA
ncbi:MAG TPA: aminotransferase class V-fold PLP-dependent enzyme [bacterium]|nr:aminotransferase class V-fold PLP-dependent enzyme [bacterium]